MNRSDLNVTAVFVDTRLKKTKHIPGNVSKIFLSLTCYRLTEILETFPRVFCFPKSRINENGGNKLRFGSESYHNESLTSE